VNVPTATAALLRRLTDRPATLDELADLTGRSTRQVYRMLLAIDDGGWQVTTHPQPGEGVGRRSVAYTAKPKP
jgi:predicted transcriptional regulator